MDQNLTDGPHRNSPGDGPELFTTARFDTPGSLAAEVAVAGVANVTVYEVEGPGWPLRQE